MRKKSAMRVKRGDFLYTDSAEYKFFYKETISILYVRSLVTEYMEDEPNVVTSAATTTP